LYHTKAASLGRETDEIQSDIFLVEDLNSTKLSSLDSYDSSYKHNRNTQGFIKNPMTNNSANKAKQNKHGDFSTQIILS